MNSIKFKYIFFALLIAIAGCRKDEKTEVPTTITPDGDPTIEVVSGVTGLVTNEQGNPISNATVSVYNRDVTTDENGVFYVNNEGLRQVKSSVIVKKPGYFDGFKSFIPDVGRKSFIQIEMIDRGDPNSILSSEGGTVDIRGGAELSIPANAVVIKDGGSEYSGDVQVFTHWYDPTDPDLGISMPGNLLGMLEDESEVQLATYGMIAVELESPNGIALQLADNAKATLRFPVSDILNTPNSIPLWSFDESDLIWIQDGEAVLQDGFYIAEVSHFSFWNCDAPFPLIELEGRILDDGNPVINFPVTITTDGLVSGQGYTDNRGVFRGKVPKGENLLLTLRHCGQTVLSHELGSFEADENIGTIDADLSTFITTVTGRMLDCDFEPLQSAYALLRSGEDVVQVITPIADGSSADGTFSAIVVGCESSNYTIQFVDPENLKSTGIMDISTSVEVNDFEDVRICDGLDEYIEYSVDGEMAPVIMDVDVYISNDEKVLIRGGTPGKFKTFDMDVFATDKGDFNPSGMLIQGPVGPTNPELQLMCGDHVNNAFGCNQFEVRIENFGDYISGTFSGILVADKDSFQLNQLEFDEYLVEGSFRVKIDEYINTGEISGQFWVDEIPNNVRDSGEDLNIPNLYVTLQTVSGSEIGLFPTFLIASENSYKFTDLLPGSYIVRVHNSNIYEEVIMNVGSEDQDSDFQLSGNLFRSGELTISQGETFQNVDLGIILPDFVNITNMYYTGCNPDITIVTSIQGGLPPYQTALSDGQVSTSIFNVESGGIYEAEVTDAIGNTASFSLLVNDYNNRVRGRTWRDVQGGTSGVYDINDQELHDLGVLLYNDDNVLVRETVSEEGWYQFSNVPPGIYYVAVNTPSGLEILEQNTIVTNGNDINPETGRSGLFTVENCNANIRVDAGFN